MQKYERVPRGSQENKYYSDYEEICYDYLHYIPVFRERAPERRKRFAERALQRPTGKEITRVAIGNDLTYEGIATHHCDTAM